MSKLLGGLAGGGCALTGLLVVGLWLFGIGITVYGLYLAFSASIILGIIVLLFEPLPAIIGLIALFGHPDVAVKLTEWLHLPW